MKLYAKEYGSGFPLLILHGLLGSSGNWHTLTRNVFSESFRVFTLDLRNHGQSPHATEMTYGAMAADVIEFAESKGFSRFHLLGHSMGGKVAMEIAISYPEFVERLVVVDIAPRVYGDHHNYIFNALSHLNIDAISSRKEADDKLGEQITSFPVRQFLLKNLSYDAERGYSWKPNLENIQSAYAEISGTTGNGRFDGKTLFVGGGASDYIRTEDHESIKQMFPQAQIVTIDGVGHWVHAEAPDEFGGTVMDFLKQ